MHRKTLLMIALALALSAAHGAQLYRCIMIDGSERLGPQDLAARYPAAVGGCEKLREDGAPPLINSDEHGLSIVVRDIEHGLSIAVRDLVVRDPPPEQASSFFPLIIAASQRNGLDPRLVSAVIAVESAHRPTARSPKGALGLMQIMPTTGARYGVRSADELLDPKVNIETGARYLGDLHRLYPGRLDLVLAAYNAGEGAVARHGNRVPPYPETVDYVRKILARYGNAPLIRPGME